MSILMPEPPPPNRFDLCFTLFQIPIRIHPLFWLMLILIGTSFDKFSETLIWIVVATMSILVQKMSQALMLRRFGKGSRITLYFLGGYTEPEVIMWGNRFAAIRLSPIQEITSYLASPVAGFLLAILLKTGIATAGGSIAIVTSPSELPLIQGAQISLPMGNDYLLFFLLALFWVNILWGLINLAPVYPLDGGNIMRYVLTSAYPRDGISKSIRVSMIIATIAAILSIILLGSVFLLFMFGLLAFENHQSLKGREVDGF